MNKLRISNVIGSTRRHYRVCQSENHGTCYGPLWTCSCGKTICSAEGSTDKIELCDNCWVKEKGIK